MPETFPWQAPTLDPPDQRLVDAYLTVGKPLDQLAYTPDFERLIRLVEAEPSDESRHLVLMRLLRLRKMGRLPRLGYLLDDPTGL